MVVVLEVIAALASILAGILVFGTLATGGAESAPALAAGCALALCVAAIPYFLASMAHRSAERRLLKMLIDREG